MPADTRRNDYHHGNQVPASGNVTSANEMTRLREEMAFIVNELECTRRHFDEERCRWTMEKERVIAYQKHLQVQYVQVARRSITLEMERACMMHQLISELAMTFTVGSTGEMTTVYAHLDESQFVSSTEQWGAGVGLRTAASHHIWSLPPPPKKKNLTNRRLYGARGGRLRGYIWSI